MSRGSGRYEERTAALAAAVREHPDLVGLVLLGSASDDAAARRDEWSDHDFFALVREGAGPRVRPDLDWLPDRDELVLTAREGEIGFAAVYADGHVFEFAVAETGELGGALVNEATVHVDDPAAPVAALVARGRENAAAADRIDPANEARLVLVKLLIGVGRVRRGEVLVGGQMIRGWAVQALARAIRGRFPERSSAARDRNDALRRFEHDFPEWGERIAGALALPAEDAARALFSIARDALDDGWPGFPRAAAAAVARRLGW